MLTVTVQDTGHRLPGVRVGFCGLGFEVRLLCQAFQASPFSAISCAGVWCAWSRGMSPRCPSLGPGTFGGFGAGVVASCRRCGSGVGVLAMRAAVLVRSSCLCAFGATRLRGAGLLGVLGSLSSSALSGHWHGGTQRPFTASRVSSSGRVLCLHFVGCISGVGQWYARPCSRVSALSVFGPFGTRGVTGIVGPRPDFECYTAR
jgi:hypothetical protein